MITGRARAPNGRGDARATYRRAVRRCALIVTFCLLVVSAAAWVVSEELAEREALRDATTRARGIAYGVAAPLVTEGARRGEPGSLRRMERVLHARIAEGGVSHMLLWDTDGRILWTSHGDLTGQTFALSRDARDALVGQRAVAHLPGTTAAHADVLAPEAAQLEVYVGSVGADGEPFLFEAYLPANRIESDRAAVLPKLVGVGVGSAVLLMVMTLPLLLRLARRVDDEQRARTEALQRSVLSWRHQRRQLAQDLHDGVIQDMSAIGMGLALVEGGSLDGPAARAVVARMQESARRGEAALRSLVLDLAPRELAERGLAEAVVDLGRQHAGHGVDITVTCARDVHLPDGTAALVFRVVREGLRNVVKHAGARSVLVDIRVREDPDAVDVVVLDDGSGHLAATAVDAGQGLGLLAGTLRDVGGSLDLSPRIEGGARLHAVVPFVDAPVMPA